MSKGKLYYFYSTMNAGKSATLILKEYQFRQSGSTTFVLKPSLDTRSEGTISSRAIKNELPCYVFDEDTNLYQFVFTLMGRELSQGNKLDDVCVFVDEVNFITKEQVEQLFELSRSRYGVKVFCYGLKTNYLNKMFEPINRLIVLADNVEEIKSKCSCKDCDNKATTHVRYCNGEIVTEGSGIKVGDISEDEDYYMSICQTCYHKLTNTYKYNK